MTPAQMRVLRGLTDEWVDVPDDGINPVRLGKVFLDLVDLGLADMRQDRRGYCDVSTGPGNTTTWVWQRRITSAGRAARTAAGWTARPLDIAS